MKPFGKKPNDIENDNDMSIVDPWGTDEGIVEEDEEVEAAPAPAPAPKTTQQSAVSGNMLKVIAPRSYDDAPSIVGHLMDGYTVVLNIEAMERGAAMRLIDFLLGALEVMNGDFRPVTKTTLVFSPTASVSDDEGADEEI